MTAFVAIEMQTAVVCPECNVRSPLPGLRDKIRCRVCQAEIDVLAVHREWHDGGTHYAFGSHQIRRSHSAVPRSAQRTTIFSPHVHDSSVAPSEGGASFTLHTGHTSSTERRRTGAFCPSRASLSSWPGPSFFASTNAS